jgi:hypothetical protein
VRAVRASLRPSPGIRVTPSRGNVIPARPLPPLHERCIMRLAGSAIPANAALTRRRESVLGYAGRSSRFRPSSQPE